MTTTELGPVSLAERAYTDLRDRLVTLAVAPGDPINDEALARELGVGRTPVREALKRLEQDRLVITYPRRGTFATQVEITDLAFISELRAELEPLAAARAARVATPAVRQQLRAVLADLDRTDGTERELVAMLRADAAVHRAIYAAAANPYLQDTLVRLNNLATRIWCLVMDQLDGAAGHLHEHSDLLTAIIDGDSDRASALSRAHVEHFERVVRAALFSV
ncbi:MAG TPA: GntR family transcriptional regulator [Propionibacteriaceae bacterium]